VESGVVRAQTNYAVFESTRDRNTEVFNAGRYLDRVVIDDGVLRYRERLCVYDSSLIPTSMIYPV
jgi:salicylate 5-hydroxylase small subunit